MSEQAPAKAKKEIVLTGITTSGTPHLGNYAGAIRPAIEASKDENAFSYFFLADYHALIKNHDSKRLQQSALECAATWLASGLDPEKVTFYRQSDIIEIPQLNWVITCLTAKGLMNRAHAYKAAVQTNQENQSDADEGVTMGLFSYPVLMAADILMFNATKVPVGKDQIQHIEMARDIASRFNHIYGNTFAKPDYVVDEDAKTLKGLDGRKMSKSYNNTIPLFETEKKLQKSINKIVTNSLLPGEAKDPEGCTVFELYSAFSSKDDVADFRQQYADGIGWGDAKKALFAKINDELGDKREKYQSLITRPNDINEILAMGAEKARRRTTPFMEKIHKKIGISKLR
jgi:tryptophanyl-tRNA synthetase